MVRSCLFKQLTSLNIGGPAVASKVFGFPVAKISHPTTDCPTRPLLAWASSRDKDEGDEGGGDSEEEREDGDRDRDSDSEDSDDDMGVVVCTVGGKLHVNQRGYVLYWHRCDPEDTGHPLHGISYFVWHRLVRTERYKPNKKSTTTSRADNSISHEDDEDNEDGTGSEDEPSGDDLEDTSPAPRRRGRPSSERYDLVGPYRKLWVQVRYTLLPLSYPLLSQIFHRLPTILALSVSGFRWTFIHTHIIQMYNIKT